jgi:hypothetical protein
MKKFFKIVECTEEEVKNGKPHIILDDNDKFPHLGNSRVNYALLRGSGSIYVVDLSNLFPLDKIELK